MEIIQFIKQHNLSCWKHQIYDMYYCGNWYEGKADGVGLSYVPKSYIYEGSFQEGLLNGGGTLTYLKHDKVYDGNFLSGKAHGKGKYKDN